MNNNSTIHKSDIKNEEVFQSNFENLFHYFTSFLEFSSIQEKNNYDNLAKTILGKLFEIITYALRYGKTKNAFCFYNQLYHNHSFRDKQLPLASSSESNDLLKLLYSFYNIAIAGWCIKIINIQNNKKAEEKFNFHENSSQAAKDLLINIANLNKRWDITAWMYFWEISNYDLVNKDWMWHDFTETLQCDSWESNAWKYEGLGISRARYMDRKWPENGFLFLLLTSQRNFPDTENPNKYPPEKFWRYDEYKQKIDMIKKAEWFNDVSKSLEQSIKDSTYSKIIEKIEEREGRGYQYYYAKICDAKITENIKANFEAAIDHNLKISRKDTLLDFFESTIKPDNFGDIKKPAIRDYNILLETFFNWDEQEINSFVELICSDQVRGEEMQILAGEIDFGYEDYSQDLKISGSNDYQLELWENIQQVVDSVIQRFKDKDIEPDFILIPQYEKAREALLGDKYFMFNSEIMVQLGVYDNLKVFEWPHANPKHIIIGKSNIIFAGLENEYITEVNYSSEKKNLNNQLFSELSVIDMRNEMPKITISIKSHPNIVVKDLQKGAIGIRLSQDLRNEVQDEASN